MTAPTLKPCPTCGTPVGQQDTSRTRIYCDSHCRRRAKYRRRLGRPLANTTPDATHCDICGTPLAGMNRGARHCSKRCGARAVYRRKTGLPPTPQRPATQLG